MTITTEQLLDFEAKNPTHVSRKETLIRDELGITPARYYQLLHRAANSAVGIAHDPITARTIRARRHTNRQSDTERTPR